jgi:hypothetical protein
MILYPLYAAWHNAFVHGGLAGSSGIFWMGAAVTAILMIGAGFMAARWNRFARPGRCAVLGGLAGGLAGTIVFCLWGAAAAGSTWPVWVCDQATSGGNCQPEQVEMIGAIVLQTLGMFLVLFLGGTGLGVVGGRLGSLRSGVVTEVFVRSEPQMALNASITAVPASIVAAGLTAFIFPRLADSVGRLSGETEWLEIIAILPLIVALLLVLISHFALTLVVPHEVRQADHLCGLDEVKMGAYVGIGAAPFLMVLLLVIRADLLLNPLVLIAFVICSGMSLKSVQTLYRLVLPKRASFPVPDNERQKTEASLFGTIANSHGPRLVVLCSGCGLMMVLPLSVCVIAVLINLSGVPANLAFMPLSEIVWRLFLTQAWVSSAAVAGVIAVLSMIYLFYLKLGRWFSMWNAQARDGVPHS